MHKGKLQTDFQEYVRCTFLFLFLELDKTYAKFLCARTIKGLQTLLMVYTFCNLLGLLESAIMLRTSTGLSVSKTSKNLF